MVNKLQIVRVDNLSVQRVDLQIGDNIIGRGAATGSVDNPIAEHAVTIYLEPTGEMTITPMLACYMKSGNSVRWRSLRIGSTVPIELGDICSLLPDKSWFKITSSNSSTKMGDNDHDSGKRKSINSLEEEPPDKKLRKGDSVETIYSQSKSVPVGWDTERGTLTVQELENRNSQLAQPSNTGKDNLEYRDERSASIPSENGSVQEVSTDRANAATPSVSNVAASVPRNDSLTSESPANADSSASKEAQSPNRDEASKKIKWDCGRHFSDQTDQGGSEAPAEETREDSTARPENNPTTQANVSSDEPPRNKCAYGTRCYRRHPEHKRQFSHPGDPDYEIPDTRPECPYGVRCYRKNPQHKRDFKHTNNRPSRAQTPIRGGMSDATSGTEQSSAEESVDDSDYEPSFNGGTSDEYRSDLDGLSEFDGISDVDD